MGNGFSQGNFSLTVSVSGDSRRDVAFVSWFLLAFTLERKSAAEDAGLGWSISYKFLIDLTYLKKIYRSNFCCWTRKCVTLKNSCNYFLKKDCLDLFPSFSPFLYFFSSCPWISKEDRGSFAFPILHCPPGNV